MVFSCEKCIDILKGASVGGGELTNLKTCHFSHFQFHLCHQMSLLKYHCTFFIYGPLVKTLVFRFVKDALLTELSPRMYSSSASGVHQHVLGDNSVQRASLKNLKTNFLTNGPKMKKVQWDFRSDLWWRSWNWKCENWQGFRTTLSPPPTDATFKMSLHFLQLETIVQKRACPC